MISTYNKNFNGIDGFVNIEPYDYKTIKIEITFPANLSMGNVYAYIENNKDIFDKSVMVEKKIYGILIITTWIAVDEVDTKVKQFFDKVNDVMTIVYQKNVLAIEAANKAIEYVKNWS